MGISATIMILSNITGWSKIMEGIND